MGDSSCQEVIGVLLLEWVTRKPVITFLAIVGPFEFLFA